MISVIIATKNGERFIERAIRSVLAQRGVDLEIVVVDDASTDGTAGVVRAVAKRDSRVRLVQREKNEGPGKARNFGIAQARGEYIAIIDDDDLWPDADKLKMQADFLDLHPDYVLVGVARVDVVDEEGNALSRRRYPIGDSAIRAALLGRNCFMHSGVLYRKDVFDRLGGYKDMRLAEDYDLWFRMGMVGKFANIDALRISWAYRAYSSSARRKWGMNRATLRLIWMYRKQYPHFVRALLRGIARLAWFGILGLSSPYALIRKKGLS